MIEPLLDQTSYPKAEGPSGGGRSPEIGSRGFGVFYPVATRWADDDDFGHINNTAYLSFFDTAVNGWLMSATALDTRQLAAIGVVAEVQCRYLRQAQFPARLQIGIGLERLGASSVVYRLGVFDADSAGEIDGPIALGRFVHVYVDRLQRRPVAIPSVVREVLENLGSTEAPQVSSSEFP